MRLLPDQVCSKLDSYGRGSVSCVVYFVKRVSSLVLPEEDPLETLSKVP